MRARGGRSEDSNQLIAQIQERATALLTGGDLMQSIRLPEGEDINEWMAINVCEFLESSQTLYSIVAGDCSGDTERCRLMSAGPDFQYLWADGKAYKKPTEVTAPEYIRLLFAWVSEQISDPTLFPVEAGMPFPKTFMATVRNIFKRLFRVYAHIYMCHFDAIVSAGCEAHLNTCTKHFVLFVREFGLVDEDELEPIRPVIAKW